MIQKKWLGLGIAAVTALLLAPAFLLKNSSLGKTPGHDVPSTALPAEAGPMQARVVMVKPADLADLAAMVDLSESPNQGFKQAQWAKAIPVAESLLQQSCDCEQRNWLTQFVNVGNMALSGAPAYRKFAPILATMYRDDHELASGLPSN